MRRWLGRAPAPAGWRTALAVVLGLAMLLTSAPGATVPARAAARSLVRLTPPSPSAWRDLQRRGFDLVTMDPETGALDGIVSAAERRWLQQSGYEVVTLQADFEAGLRALQAKPGLGAYHTWEETVAELESLAAAYPQWTRLEILGTSVEGRPIHAMKVSDNPTFDDPDEPDILIVGNHHARELMTVEVPLHFLRHLLENGARNTAARRILETREVWFVPMLNPDGHVYQETTQLRPGWRKNRRRNADGSLGVDLNRNYAYKWGFDEVGSSSNGLSETYRGEAPFSEPETQALRSLVERQAFVISISYHSFGRLVLFPWGWTDRSLTPDHATFATLADSMVRRNGYRPGNAALGTIYLTNGEFDDYMYGERTATKSQATLAFTVELNSAEEGGFWPREELIEPTCDAMLDLNLFVCRTADRVRGSLPPPPPSLTAVQDAAAPWRIQLDWQVTADPENPIDHFEVFEIDPIGQPLVGAGAVLPAPVRPGVAADGSDPSLEETRRILAPDVRDTTYTVIAERTGIFAYGVTAVDADGQRTDSDIAWFTIPEVLAVGVTDLHVGLEGRRLRARWFTQTLDAPTRFELWGRRLAPGETAGDVAEVTPGSGARLLASAWFTRPGPATLVTAVEPGRYGVVLRAADADAARVWGPWTLEVAVRTRLRRPFPNPFNPSTRLAFDLDRDGPIVLEILGVDGRRIRRLHAGWYGAGSWALSWDGKDDRGLAVASGVYFVRLQAGGRAFRHRLVVLR